LLGSQSGFGIAPGFLGGTDLAEPRFHAIDDVGDFDQNLLFSSFELECGDLPIGFGGAIFAALGTGLTLYLFLWCLVRNRWLAAAITICVWADIDLGVSYFAHRFLFVHQIYMVASDLIAHLRGHGLLPRPLFPFQWRLTNAALDLPFLFLQLLVTSVAREHPSRRNNLALSGLVFALTFYAYFFLWTMIAAGLCLAAKVDRPGRSTYAWTLGLGVALGWPQIAHDYLMKNALSAEGVKHFWLLAAPIPCKSTTWSIPAI